MRILGLLNLRYIRWKSRYSINALHYFDLVFLDDGPALTVVNTVGVWFRSHILGLRSDQGFCLERKLFERLDGFSEDVSYGEDHLFV